MTTSDPFDLKDFPIVITGAAGQLGREYAEALLSRSAKVAAIDLKNQPILDELKKKYPENFLFFEGNILSRPFLESSLQAIEAKWGAVRGLINNAALDTPPNASADENGPFETYPETSFDQTMDVNVKGSLLCCQVFGGAMAKSGRGSIINISSIYGVVSPDQRIYDYRRENNSPPFFKPISYSVSKSAVLNLSRYLATYWASQKVRVNSLVIAGVFNQQDERFLKSYCSRVPLGRMAKKDEYNASIIFLLSEASSYMTGSTLTIDGGWTAW